MKPTPEERFWSKVQKSDRCWEWTGGKRKGGYGNFGIKPRWISAHRFSYELHFGPVPDGLDVLHTCDNPACVRPEHLFLGTAQDNVNDCMSKGRWGGRPSQKGERNCSAKLSVADVVTIRQRHRAGESVSSIAEAFPVKVRAIQQIIDRKRWSHVD